MCSDRLINLACLLTLLLSTCGCVQSADQMAGQEMLQERKVQLEQLKESIKDLPRLQAQVDQARAENKKLRAR